MNVILYLAALIFFLFYSGQSYAQAQLFPEFSESGAAVVTATVGDNYLNVNGYQSPNASVVIETTSGIFLQSTTADGNGYFSMTNILITDNFPGFCFTAIDFERLGESESCVEISEIVTEEQTYSDIFLPPTIGLSKRLIAAGEDAQIFGYSMPHAQIDIEFEGESVTMQADETGYYEYIYEDVPAGTYAFASYGKLDGVDSLDPLNKAILEAITFQEQIRQDLTGFIEDTEKKFPGAIILLSLLLLLFALLIALLWKTKPKLFYAFFDLFKRRYPMHHDYFLFKQ